MKEYLLNNTSFYSVNITVNNWCNDLNKIFCLQETLIPDWQEFSCHHKDLAIGTREETLGHKWLLQLQHSFSFLLLPSEKNHSKPLTSYFYIKYIYAYSLTIFRLAFIPTSFSIFFNPYSSCQYLHWIFLAVSSILKKKQSLLASLLTGHDNSYNKWVRTIKVYDAFFHHAYKK